MDHISGYVTNLPSEEALKKQWDILFFNRVSFFDEYLAEVKKEMNTKLVVDMDDDWILPANHINYDTYAEFKLRIENNLRVADLVTCTNERLAKRIRPFNQNVKIFPNALPYGHHQFTSDKIESDRIRIFWCGSVTHEQDISILKYPIKRLLEFKSDIRMVLGGYNDENILSKNIWDRMLSTFTNGKTLDYKVLKGLKPTEYMKLYEQGDIMVIPLEDSTWHGCKSNLKILEAASKKIPVICSAVEPYINDSEAPVLWVRNQSDWYKHLKFLIKNKNAREDYGEKIYEWANEKYNIFKINEDRRTAFADLIKA